MSIRTFHTENGRPMVCLREDIPFAKDDQLAINRFYSAAELEWAERGYTRWAAVARINYETGKPVWHASITLVGPGEWQDRRFIDDMIARA